MNEDDEEKRKGNDDKRRQQKKMEGGLLVGERRNAMYMICFNCFSCQVVLSDLEEDGFRRKMTTTLRRWMKTKDDSQRG